MSGDQAEVEKKEPLFWPLNLLPGLTHIYTSYHIADSHIADGRQYDIRQLGGYSTG